MTPIQWIIGDDTGVSSKTIWAVMMGAVTEERSSFRYDTPHDPDDFGRCYRLLKKFPAWNGRLGEVAEIFPKWGPMVARWDEMTAIYERDLASGKSSELYDLMQKLQDEGMLADGWVRTSPCGWEKKNSSQFKGKGFTLSMGQ